LWSAAGTYQIGTFDGNIYTPETRTLKAELGPNGYAAQTWSNLPVEDELTIQISWMINGNYPYMPFNQQMTFPVEISLNNTLDGVRLVRVPIRELQSLRNLEHHWYDHTLEPGYNRREIFKKYGPSWQEFFPISINN
jgi:levanase/fructan beta-fructosidase